MSENLWPEELAALVRGLAHALSNRVGTVVAAAGMLAPGAPAPAPVVGMLREEGDRLDALLALVRLLGQAPAEPEPLLLPDVVTPAVELHSHHPAWRDVPVTVTADPAGVPVRVSHAGLTRALLVLLSAAKREGAATVAWAGTTLTVGGAPGDATVARVAGELLGGEVAATGAGYEMRLPAL